MKKQVVRMGSRLEQAYRRFMEADDPWTKEGYRVEYEAQLVRDNRTPVEVLIDDALLVLECAQPKTPIYKPKGRSIKGFAPGNQ